MARLVAAGTPDAVASASTQDTQVGGSGATVRYALVRPRLTHTVWTAAIAGTRLTDLLLDADGTPIDSVTADDTGQIPAFRLPDGLLVNGVWLDPDDVSSDRYWLPVRIGPADVEAVAPRPPVGTPAGYTPTIQPSGGILWSATPGLGSNSVTAVDYS